MSIHVHYYFYIIDNINVHASTSYVSTTIAYFHGNHHYEYLLKNTGGAS